MNSSSGVNIKKLTTKELKSDLRYHKDSWLLYYSLLDLMYAQDCQNELDRRRAK